jgi:hypothetical protein
MISESIADLLLGLLPGVILILLWLIPALIPLSNLRRREMEETAKAIWVLIIVLLPVVGPITYFLMKNEKRDVDRK